jgi:class 3 adenylate cyclase
MSISQHSCDNLPRERSEMAETRKLAAILAADVVGFSRLAAADEDRTLARLRALRSDLIDPTVAVHNGRIVKRTGDGLIAAKEPGAPVGEVPSVQPVAIPRVEHRSDRL